jgi:predicted nucleic acid-binding protein
MISDQSVNLRARSLDRRRDIAYDITCDGSFSTPTSWFPRSARDGDDRTLVLEYEDAALRQIDALLYTPDEVREIIDFLCWAGEATPIYYLWRPFLRDTKDDLVLEAAVAGRCDTIVTFNQRDFNGVDKFGLQVRTSRAFLEELET